MNTTRANDSRPTIYELDKHMALLKQRFDDLNQSNASRFDRIDQKLDGIIKTLEELPKTYATKKEVDELKTNSVSVSSFRAYQVVLGAISTTALAYLVNLALQRIFP